MIQLIGLLDSPYVRRVAISLKLMGVPFEHRLISVFRGYDEFEQINPVVKAPTLVTESGVVLMDSTLILEYLETVYPGRLGTASHDAEVKAGEFRQLGLALAACEKVIQIVYETTLRPTDRQHGPWIDRVRAQALAALRELEIELAKRGPRPNPLITQAFITSAVTWRFATYVLPDLLKPEHYPSLNSHCAGAEELPEFKSTPWE